MLRPGAALQRAWRNKFLIHGRAQRSEYWWTILFTALLIAALTILDTLIFPNGVSGDLSPTYSMSGWTGFLNDLNGFPMSNALMLILVVPLTFQAMRRLHDIGWNGGLAIIVAVFSIVTPYLPVESLWLPDVWQESDGPRRSAFPAFWGIAALWIAYAITSILQFFLNIRPSEPRTNRYGPHPEGLGDVDVFS